MIILAFDSALEGSSAAVTDDQTVLAAQSDDRSRGQAETLIPLIEQVLADAAVRYEQLDAIAVTVGPGTFTGLRIALAAARGIGLAAQKPVIGLTTLEGLAAAIPPNLAGQRTRIAAIDARRDEIYLQSFDARMQPLSMPMLCPLTVSSKQLPQGPFIVTGSAASLLSSQIPMADANRITLHDNIRIDAAHLARLAATKPLPKQGQMPAPLYLRAPDAKLPSSTS